MRDGTRIFAVVNTAVMAVLTLLAHIALGGYDPLWWITNACVSLGCGWVAQKFYEAIVGRKP
jgi:hypothetical protein